MYTARVLCLRDCAVALPGGDVRARAGETVTVELHVAVLMQRYGLARILAIQEDEER